MAVIGVASIVGGAACALIVGDVEGNRPDDGGAPGDTWSPTKMPDSGSPADGGSGMEGGTGPDATTVMDGSGACKADLDGDSTNCGWCGHDCQGAACTGGACSAQTVFAAGPTSLAYDQGSLFYTGGINNAITALAVGSLMTQTVAPPQNNGGHIVARSPYVFWTTADGTIHRALEDGGAQTALVPPTYAANSRCLAANSNRVYWWTTGAAYSVPVDSDGSAPPVLEHMGPTGASGCVNADDQTLAVLTDYTLMQRDLDSGLATQATLQNPAETHYVVLAGAHAVAFTTSTSDAGTTGHLDVVAKGTTTVVEVATFPWSTLMGATGDDGGVYWSLQAEARIDGCSDPLCTGGTHHYSPAYLSPPSTIGTLALDATHIYFSRGNSSVTILSVPR
jgi:hypothetical protein